MLTYQVPKSPSNQVKGSSKLPRPLKPNQTLPLGPSTTTVNQTPLTQNRTAVTLQRAANQPPPIEQAPAIVNEVLRSSGQPLDESTRTFMEPRFGYNFGSVRIHTDAKAAESAQAVNARAYTVGHHVVMRQGEYAPETDVGKRLLAHELVHVVQQSGGERLQKLSVGTVRNVYEQEAKRVVEGVVGISQLDRRCSIHPTQAILLSRGDRQPIPTLVQRDNEVSREDVMLVERRANYYRLVTNWYMNCGLNLEANARSARAANQRFIEFEEGGISQLRAASSIGSGVAYLFGTTGSVVALCIIVLTEIAAQNLSSRSAKIAAAAARLDNQLSRERNDLNHRKDRLDNRIRMIETFDSPIWLSITRAIRQAGVPEFVPENIVYRDLLLAFARGGDYNVSGSQWNVNNMGIFGDAPWYHSWDWGSPGWTNGKDIVDELNALAEGDPSTRIRVSINPP